MVPFGAADTKNKTTDVAVVAISNSAKLAAAVANRLEGKIRFEVMDPRTLEPLDIEIIRG